jgi:pimeloyl-ACP methyl ester carboxylesterase
MPTPTPGRVPLVLLPGILLPAATRYGRLLEALGPDVLAVPKDLEIYGGAVVPPPGYGFATEVEGIARAADAAGFDRFHLFGHSAGGACALAFAAADPDRVLTLAIDEPATDFSPESLQDTRSSFLPFLDLPPDELLRTFARRQVGPGVELPPPPEPPPDWMAVRPAGIAAFVRAELEAEVDLDRLRDFDRPVLYSWGTLSHPSWEQMADRLAGWFPKITVERFDGFHHLNAAHVAEPERVAASLRALWASA